MGYNNPDQDIARIADTGLETGSSLVGPAKYLSKFLPTKGISKPGKVLMEDVVGNGITEVNRSGNWQNPDEKFQRGMMNSPSIRLMQLFGKYVDNRGNN